MAVREGLLVLLAERPRHGYELKTEFEQRTARLWPLNTGQVYTTLDRLQRDGLVERMDGDGHGEGDGRGDLAGAGRAGGGPPSDRRRHYRLTDAGRDEAEAWLAAQVAADTPPRDELVMKVLLAAHRDLDQAYAVIDAQRHELLARLTTVRQRQREAPDSLAARLRTDVLVVRIEADLRWLDLCTDRLAAEARARPAGETGKTNKTDKADKAKKTDKADKAKKTDKAGRTHDHEASRGKR